MDDAGPEAALIEVTLKRDTEQIADIVRILAELDVPVADCQPGPTPANAGRVRVRIPPDRAFAAVLALNCHGFLNVRVYGGQ